jgi:hypothetical protein
VWGAGVGLGNRKNTASQKILILYTWAPPILTSWSPELLVRSKTERTQSLLSCFLCEPQGDH